MKPGHAARILAPKKREGIPTGVDTYGVAQLLVEYRLRVRQC